MTLVNATIKLIEGRGSGDKAYRAITTASGKRYNCWKSSLDLAEDHEYELEIVENKNSQFPDNIVAASPVSNDGQALAAELGKAHDADGPNGTEDIRLVCLEKAIHALAAGNVIAHGRGVVEVAREFEQYVAAG